MNGARVKTWLSKPFIFFSLIMVLKILLFKFIVFPEATLWLQLATGLFSVWILFSLIEGFAYEKKLFCYLLVDLIVTSIYFAGIMYYKYFGIIVTYHALQQVNQVTEVRGSIFSLLHPYFLFIYTDIVVFSLLFIHTKFRFWSKTLNKKPSRVLISAIMGVSLFWSGLAVWSYRDSRNELKQAEKMGILNYQVFALLSKPFLSKPDSRITQKKINEEKQISPLKQRKMWQKFKGKNVVVLQLEAFQNFLLEAKINNNEITPQLNELVRNNAYFNHFYQQVGQGNTSDAEFVVNTSYYVAKHGASSKEYGHLDLPSMPKALSQEGYTTATFHTNHVTFWNRKELYQGLGFDTYYDAEFFGQEDIVFFGASDEVLYDRTANELLKLKQQGKRFYAQVISMSAHHPFNIPKAKVRMQLPSEYENTLLGNYLTAQNYADYAVGKFIAKLKEDGLWEDTVLVIYGDHLGLPIYSLKEKEKQLLERLLQAPYQYADMLNIPLIIVGPGFKPKSYAQVGGQVDIFPTLANLLGISLENHLHFGQDLFNYTHNLLPQRYYLPTGSYITDHCVFVPGIKFQDGQCYPFDESKKTAYYATEEQYNRALSLLELSDRYVSQLPEYEEKQSLKKGGGVK